MKARILASAAVVLAIGVGAHKAHAAIVTFNYDTIISGDPPGGTSIATLTITDTGANMVHMRLDHNASSANGQFITDLYFNLNPFVTMTQTNQNPSAKFNGGLAQGLNSQSTAGLNFDALQQFQTTNSGGGAKRLKPGEFIEFDISGTGINATDFISTAIPQGGQRKDVLSMIHLQGIEGDKSVKLGAVVPEPASLAAMGLGLAAFLRRRRAR